MNNQLIHDVKKVKQAVACLSAINLASLTDEQSELLNARKKSLNKLLILDLKRQINERKKST